jgi:RNA polymerase sigma-70 factor (ECF subfamily)
MDAPDAPADLDRLASLYTEHRPRLLALVQRRGAAAEDVLQEAFLRAARRWPVYCAQPPVEPFAWLYRITMDCLADAWRKDTRQGQDVRRTQPLPEASSALLAKELVHPQSSPSSAAARKELIGLVHDALDALREEDREVLWMRHADELTFPEIAGVLEISTSAATMRYVRALDTLRGEWQRRHPEGR